MTSWYAITSCGDMGRTSGWDGRYQKRWCSNFLPMRNTMIGSDWIDNLDPKPIHQSPWYLVVDSLVSVLVEISSPSSRLDGQVTKPLDPIL